MGRLQITTIVVTVTLSIACSEAANKPKFELPANGMAVEIDGGYLIVAKVSVGDLRDLRFLVDTGASDTAIDRGVAEHLRITGHPAKVFNFDKTLALERAQVPEMAFGPEQALNVPVTIENLSNLQPGRARLDGILGLDELRRMDFIVDYAKKRIIFGAVEKDPMRSVPMRVNANSIRVQVELDGRPLWMIADTGAPGPVFYEDALKHMQASYHSEDRIRGLSLGGPIETPRAFVPRLRLGGQDLSREAVLLTAPGPRVPGDFAGYLGLASLEAREIAFDFATNKLSWKR